jgi:hypothetical protein
MGSASLFGSASVTALVLVVATSSGCRNEEPSNPVPATTGPTSTSSGGGEGGMGDGGHGGDGMGGDGGGGMAECAIPSDCPAPDTECQSPTCDAGVCGVAFEPAGTALSEQMAGNCSKAVCDGSGATTVEAEDDPFDDLNDCTIDTCNAQGTTDHAPTPVDASCAQGGTVCDGAGACVECNTPAQCAGGTCMQHICVPASCGDRRHQERQRDRHRLRRRRLPRLRQRKGLPRQRRLRERALLRRLLRRGAHLQRRHQERHRDRHRLRRHLRHQVRQRKDLLAVNADCSSATAPAACARLPRRPAPTA